MATSSVTVRPASQRPTSQAQPAAEQASTSSGPVRHRSTQSGPLEARSAQSQPQATGSAAPRQPLSALAGAGRAVANSAPATLAGMTLNSVASALPLQQTATLATRIGNPNRHPDPAKLRTDLQTQLATLADNPQDPALQMAAHDALRQYGAHAGTWGDAIGPALHKAAAVSLAGTSPTFGVGRNTGVAAADAALRAARGQAVPLGVSAGTAGAAAPEHAVQNAGAQWALGSLGGAIGNLAGAQLVAPLVNLASRQHAAVDPKAIVPDNIRNSMNDLQAGSGDKLREQVAQRQTEIAALNSNTNVGIGQAAFVAATAVRTTAQGDQALGFGGTVGVGLAVSAAAGAAIGASMGMNAALSTVPVPKLADLQNAKNEGRPLSSVSTDPLPLFYTKHMPALGPVAALSNAWTNSPLRDPTPGENPRAARQPQNLAQATSMVTSDVGNVAAAVANRTGRLASSTMTLALTSAATPLAAAAFSENPPAALATSVVGASVGIYSAIKPWFGNLAGGIAGTEGRVQTARQDAVNAAAARHAQAQQPAPDLEMGMVAGTGAGASQGGSSQPPRQAALR